MKNLFKTGAVLFVIAVYLVFGWLAGIAVLAWVLLRVGVYIVRLSAALAPTTTCRWCRARVSQFGEWSCGHCRARTRGSAWWCGHCGEMSGFIACPRCGMAIANPLARE